MLNGVTTSGNERICATLRGTPNSSISGDKTLGWIYYVQYSVTVWLYHCKQWLVMRTANCDVGDSNLALATDDPWSEH